jgi:ferredoxin
VAVILRLRLDPVACTGHGLCAGLLPERIGLDEWGYPVITGDVPHGLARDARRAVRACPTLALRLSRVHGPEDPSAPRVRQRERDS